MAEPVGLALGTIALASLFTTCIDCMEYFELSKSYEDDYGVACLKLSGLKSRLDTWGESLGLSDGSPSNWVDQGLPLQNRHERVIESNLRGISDIFCNAELLKNKYSLLPRKSRQSSLASSLDHKKTSRHFVFGRSRGLSLFRRSTVWAIRDKQKFDDLLHDLDFLIRNLEAVSARIHRAIHPAAMSASRNTQPVPVARTADRTTSTATTSQSRNAHSDTVQANSSRRRSLGGTITQHQTDNTTSGAQTAQTTNNNGGTCRVDNLQGHAGLIQGISDESESSQGSYSVGTASMNTRTLQKALLKGDGVVATVLDNFFNAPARERAHDGRTHVDEEE